MRAGEGALGTYVVNSRKSAVWSSDFSAGISEALEGLLEDCELFGGCCSENECCLLVMSLRGQDVYLQDYQHEVNLGV